MSSEPLNKKVSERICNHMNKDHKNAVMIYASHYGGLKDFKEAIMTDLTSQHIELNVDNQIIHITFDHALKDSEDAHRTLVAMLKSIPKQS